MALVMVQLILAGRTAGRSSSFIADNEAPCEQTEEDGFKAAQLLDYSYRKVMQTREDLTGSGSSTQKA
jgi:hypothetical protein